MVTNSRTRRKRNRQAGVTESLKRKALGLMRRAPSLLEGEVFSGLFTDWSPACSNVGLRVSLDLLIFLEKQKSGFLT